MPDPLLESDDAQAVMGGVVDPDQFEDFSRSARRQD